jgi:hypothetical protein
LAIENSDTLINESEILDVRLKNSQASTHI